MANVTRVYESPDGIVGGLDIESQAGFTGTRVFQVEFDAFNTSIWNAITASNPSDPLPSDELAAIPEYGAAHPDEPTAFVINKHAEPIDGDPSIWKVTVGYGYPKIDANVGGSPPAPTNSELGSSGADGAGAGQGGGEKPTPLPTQRITRGTWTRQKAWEKDLDGTFLENSAHDPFDPPLTTEQPLSEWTITRTQLTFSDAWKTDFEGAVNNGIYTVGDKACAAYTLKVARITGEEVPATDRTPRYHTVTIVIQEDPAGWRPRPLDRGWRQLVGGVQVPMFDGTGAKPAQPLLLDGVGVKKAVGAAAVYLGPFKLYPPRNFDWLAITWRQ